MQVKMGNQENLTINANLSQEKAVENGRRGAASKQRKNTIFAGDLPIHKDPIALRRQQAQKKAMKFVMDAWGGDRKMDQSQDEIRALQQQQWDEQSENLDLARSCTDRMESLRQQYGVDMDSDEQKDLDLLLKASSTGSTEYLSQEERDRLEELSNIPRTEYQQKCLALEGERHIFEIRAENARSYAQYLQSSLTDMKLERLKFHKMADAKEDADKVMEQASEEIQGMLWEEAKDHVDETYEEQREEAKEEAEKKEELEEKVELRKEQKELIEERVETAQENSREAEKAQREQEKDAREEAQLLKDMADAGMDVAGASDTVKAQIKDMLNKLKLVEADIKGIEIDEEL